MVDWPNVSKLETGLKSLPIIKLFAFFDTPNDLSGPPLRPNWAGPRRRLGVAQEMRHD
jgi:hypothetical protein